MSEENAFCNKCGFLGKADRLGRHTRPTDGRACMYAVQPRIPKSPMTDQDHAKIVREALERLAMQSDVTIAEYDALWKAARVCSEATLAQLRRMLR